MAKVVALEKDWVEKEREFGNELRKKEEKIRQLEGMYINVLEGCKFIKFNSGSYTLYPYAFSGLPFIIFSQKKNRPVSPQQVVTISPLSHLNAPFLQGAVMKYRERTKAGNNMKDSSVIF